MEDKKLEEHLGDEQGFNDTELEDIMNEIESLENEYSEDNIETTQEVVAMSDPIEEEMNESSAEVVSIDHAKESHAHAGEPVSMEFNVSGHMNMHLKFNVEGKWVSVKLAESEGLVVETEDGAKFCLPLSKAS